MHHSNGMTYPHSGLKGSIGKLFHLIHIGAMTDLFKSPIKEWKGADFF